MSEKPLSESNEMYLVTVYRLTEQASTASTKEIATHLKVSLPSVTEQLKRLDQRGYLKYEWRVGATLTEKGQQVALNLLRKHRLIETFLVKMAGYRLDEVHKEACQLEHAISDRLANALEAMLDFPRTDPHGHAIPNGEGQISTEVFAPLSSITIGQSAIIQAVSDENPSELSYLVDRGVVPGTKITVTDIAPHNGPFVVDVEGKSVALDYTLAEKVSIHHESSNNLD